MKLLLLLCAIVLTFPGLLSAQPCITSEFVSGFENQPHDPAGSIPVEGPDGALYFTTSKGGWADDGAIVKIAPDGTRSVLVHFNRQNRDRSPQAEPIGHSPAHGLVIGPDGELYGTTQSGGNSTIGVSTVFRCTKAGVYTTLGYLPWGAASTPGKLQTASDGSLYGITEDGGMGYGTVFRVSPNTPGNYTACTVTTIIQFTGLSAALPPAEGSGPRGPLRERIDGGVSWIYGVLTGSLAGGANYGRIYRFRISGPAPFQPETVGSLAGIGATPEAGLVEGPDGTLYGTCSRGAAGGGGYGCVYKIAPGGTVSQVYDFGSTAGAYGYAPVSPLIVGSDGLLYGSNSANNGHLFRMSTDGSLAETVCAFTGTGGAAPGIFPTGLVQRRDGTLWGLTKAGGSGERGVLFRLSANGPGWSYQASWPMGLRQNAAEGAFPVGGLVSDGTLLYGTTENGGSLANNGNGFGTIFSLNPATGQKTTLFSFVDLPGAEGQWPRATLLRRPDGFLYGTTSAGGPSGYGTVFRFRPAGGASPAEFTMLTSFAGGSSLGSRPAGRQPEGPLTDGGDGYLYGTTRYGGASDFGTIFRLSPTGGQAESLVHFTGTGGAFPGREPVGGLTRQTLQGASRLWGTTFYGSAGTSNYGTVFSYDPGTGSGLTRLDFIPGGTSGYGPVGTLLSHEGLLYGTCKFGGTPGLGTVWTFAPDSGAFSVIHAFDRPAPFTVPHAAYPLAGLTLGADGAFYGTASESTEDGQPGSFGNLYRISPAGEYRVIGTFTNYPGPATPALAGANPQHGALCLGPDGMLYGTARNGGTGYGSLFRINPGPLVQTGTPLVTSLSTVTATGFINPNGLPCSRSLEYLSTADLSTGGTPFRLTLFEAPTTTAGSFSLNLTGLTAQTDYAIRAVAGTPNCGDRFGEWVIFRLTGRALWLGQQFGSSAGNPAIGGLPADPEGDGLSNLHEWMLDTDPRTASAGSLPVITPEAFPPGTLRVTYPFAVGRSLDGDEWVELQNSQDLSSWITLGPAASLDAGLTATPATISYSYLMPAGTSRDFFRTAAGIRGWERIPTLFNTGVGSNRLPLPDNTVDPYWQAAAFIGGAWNDYGFAYHRNSQAGYPVSPAGPWLGDNSTSGWIGFGPGLPGGNGNTYLYRTSFIIPWGVDPRTVAISGRLTSDDQMSFMALNANPAIAGSGQTFITGDSNYSQFGREWLLTRGFINGRNTLDFHVGDLGAPSGFRAELEGTMGRAGRVAIPGCINSGCAVLDGPPRQHGETLTNVRIFKAGVPLTPVVHTSAGGWPVAPGAWFNETYGSAWMKPDSTVSHAAGAYNWILEFDLTGLDPSTVEIRGRVAADDAVSLILNSSGFVTASANYGGWTPFEVPRRLLSALNPGLNTLTFQVTNAPAAGNNPSGLRYEFLHAAAAPLAP